MTSASAAETPIAVVGLAAWYPGASDARSLWENVLARRREFRRTPPGRLSLDDYYDPDPGAQDKTYARRGAYIDGFVFDWAALRIPQRTYETTDVAQWLALEVALRALRDAGIGALAPAARERAGVVVGNTLTGEQSRALVLRLRWPYARRALLHAAAARGLGAAEAQALAAAMEATYKSAFPAFTEDSLAGNLSNTIAGRICNHLDWHGGGYTVDGACASSLLAVTTAASRLAAGEADLMLAGGVDISLDPFELVGFSRAGALTRDEMRVYDRHASGFIPGEGCGFVALRRLADARAAGERVYAVLRGWGVSSDGRGGIMAPSAAGQALALARAYQRAGYPPQALDFLEGHGTGTVLGDRTELLGIVAAMRRFGAAAPRSLAVTSLKSIVGHTKAAAGIGALLKAVMAVNRRVVPPTAGCQHPHAVFADAAQALYPALEGEVRAPADVLRAGVSGMGFGGINVHVTLESGDPPAESLAPGIPEEALLAAAQPLEVFPLAAEDGAALRAQAEALAREAEALSQGELVDLAAHLGAQAEAGPRRPLRAALVVGSPEALAAALEALAAHLADGGAAPYQSPLRDLWLGAGTTGARVGFLIPGQGSQQLGMGRVLVARHPWARELLDSAERWVQEEGGRSLSAALFPPAHRAADPAELERWTRALAQTEVAQPALCLTALLYARLLAELGVEPAQLGGHSLGELVALHLAGAFDAEVLLRLAARRGAAMAQRPGGPRGAMGSLACDVAQAERLCQAAGGVVTVANRNSRRQVVVSGEEDAVRAVLRAAAAAGIAGRGLPVSNAFHSPLMAEAAARFRADLSRLCPERPAALRVPVRSGLPGATLSLGTDLRQHLHAQLLGQVDFLGVLTAMDGASAPGDLLVEVGPGRVLCGLAAELQDGAPGAAPCLPIASQPGADGDLCRLLATLHAAGAPLRWSRLYERRLARPYRAPATRIFIENPCERAFPALPAAPRAPADAVASALSGLDASAGEIAAYAARRGGFLQEVIRADFRALRAEGAPPQVAPAAPAAGAPPAPAAGVPQAPQAPQDLLALLRRLIQGQTGYPPDSFGPASRLQADLNLDSIKAASLVALAAEAAGVKGRLREPLRLANASLQELVDALQQARDSRGQAMEAPAAAGARPTWVRDYTITWDVAPPPRPPWDLRGARLAVLCAPGEEAAQAAVCQALAAAGARPQPRGYDDAAAPDEGRVALLPRQGMGRADAAGWLQRQQQRLAAAASRLPRGALLAIVSFAGPDPETGCAAGFARSLWLERPDLRVRLLRLDPGLAAPELAARLLAELAGAEPVLEATIDGAGVRRAPRARLLLPRRLPPRQKPLGAADVVLVTGGGKGITGECALGLAQRSGARLALLGSSPPERDAALQRNLQRFAAAAPQARYYACDLTDADAVTRVVARVRDELGPITAVVHGAGRNLPLELDATTPDTAFAEVAPKVLGAEHLWRALADQPLQLFVGLSSIIGTTGMPGNCWYAFANQALDQLLDSYAAERPGLTTLALAYSVWAEVGMGVTLGSLAALAARGIGAIPVVEGVARFLALLDRDPGAGHVVVAAELGPLPTWRALRPAAAADARFLEDLQAHEPEVALRSRPHLDPGRDPYLIDHDFRGTLLFPTVMGLEAMAQAARALAPRRPVLRVEDLSLRRPIPVDPEQGTVIEVHAELDEEDAEGGCALRAGIRCAQTGFAEDHFAARLVLGPEGGALPPAPEERAPPAGEALTLRAEELYGGLLFQGPRFQRLTAVHRLDGRRALVRAAPSAAPPGALGDPFLRDVLLHCVQLVVSRHLCLPVHIARLERFAGRGERAGEGPRWVEGEFLGTEGREDLVEVRSFDDDGCLRERLRGYRLRILEDRPAQPTPEEVAAPGEGYADERRLRAALDASAAALAVRAPELRLRRWPGIGALPRAERHRREGPLLAELARAAVRWSDEGRPVVPEPASGGPAAVALAQDDAYCLAVAGPAPQGCDLLPLPQRPPAPWEAVLGADHQHLLGELRRGGDLAARAGGRAFAALEAARKALGDGALQMTVARRAGEAVLVRAEHGQGVLWLLTLPVLLARGPERLVAVACAAP